MSKITDNRFASILSGQIQISRTYAGYVLQDDRAQADQMFEGRARTELEGRSNIVSNDLADMVDATIAQLQPGYSGDCLAEFEEMGQDDAEQSKAESAAVNNLVVENNQGFYQIQSMCMDSLLYANGTIKVVIEETEEKEVQRYQGLMPEQVAMLESQGAVLTSDEDGEQEFEMLVPKQHLKIRRINPSDFIVDPNQTTLTYEDTSFVAERTLLTRSDLVEMGYNKTVVSNLPEHNLDTEIDQQSRYVENQQNPDTAGTEDRDVIEIFECYLRATEDGETGISSLWRIMYCYDNNVVLEREKVDWIPYATASPFIVPGRWYGRSLYTKLKDIQEGKTLVMRKWIDGLDSQLNVRKYVNQNQVNMDDLMSTRLNGVVRCKGSPHDSVMLEPVADVAMSAKAMLDYYDQLRAERCGAQMDVMQPEAQVMSSVSGVSAEIQLSSTEIMSSMIAKTISETGIRNMFLLVHKTLRRQWKGTIPVKLKGQWQEVNPAEWQPRDRLNMKVGVSPGERSKKARALNEQLGYQMQMLSSGGANIMVTLNNVHRLLLDLGKSQGLDSIDSYWIDPESPESQEAQKQMGMKQQEDKQGAMQQQQQLLELEQAKLQLEKLKIDNDKADDDADNAFQIMKLTAEIEVKEAELVQSGIDSARSQAAAGTAEQGGTADQASS